MFCSLVLAATVLTANAADRLLIVGEAVWGGWFKFLTTTATAEYFTLSGVRLSAPAKGIYVKRLGNKVMKTINKK